MTKSFKFIRSGFGRLPGNTRPGSRADFRKSFTQSARKSMEDIIRRYNALISALRAATPEVMRAALEPTFDLSQEYVPKDTGRLKNSGVLSIATTSKDLVTGSITYGNAEAWYAAIVHERVDLNHAPPTRSKYLQAAMEETIDNYLDVIADNYVNLILSG